MLKLRNLLLSNKLFYIIFIFVLIVTSLRIVFEKNYSINDIPNSLSIRIDNFIIDGDKLDITNNKYHLKGTYYIKTKEEKAYLDSIRLGDIYYIKGEVSLPSKPTTKGLFNYQKYLKTKKIFYLMDISELKRKDSSYNPYFILKNIIRKRINNNPYLNTFILGDKSLITTDAMYSYQENGISHLFSISGMHITLISSIILRLLKRLKVNEYKRFYIVSIILFIYLFLIGLSPSVLRGVLFFYLFNLNNIYYFYINKINLFLLTLSISLLINPFYIYDSGFIYSYTISLSLLISSNYLNEKKYFLALLKTSFISFITSIPISLYFNSQINLLSIIYNLIFVPLVSIVAFPLALISLFIPILQIPFNFSMTIIENLSLILSKISIGKLVFKKLNIEYYILLIILIFIIIKQLNNHKKNHIKYLILLLSFHYFLPLIQNEDYLKMIDIGQGDSILLHSNNKTILVDTGGIKNFNKEEWKHKRKSSSLVKNITIPLLKQNGIKKIHYLILTHGDFDHLGETLNLLKYIKVDKIIINNNKINYLENEIIKKFDNVIIGEEGLTLTIGDFTLIQLNEDLEDENDSSQIYYLKYKDINILLTGDASIKSEKNFLDKYDLEEIDILKVGHHGSRTSTSEDLLKILKPKIALISVGKNNKFKHPHNEVLKNLNKYNIKTYRTDKLGTITVNLNNLTIH